VVRTSDHPTQLAAHSARGIFARRAWIGNRAAARYAQLQRVQSARRAFGMREPVRRGFLFQKRCRFFELWRMQLKSTTMLNPLLKKGLQAF
jgi:hypothetical protein